MSRQTEWLFEIPSVLASNHETYLYANPEYYGNSEWELLEMNPYCSPSNEAEWEGNMIRRIPIPNYTQCDFIDPRIDVSAQYALFKMMKGGSVLNRPASQLLAAVKRGKLGGIYQEDQRAPAMRAQKLGLGWWGPLIDKHKQDVNQLAVCVPPVSGTPNTPIQPFPSPQDKLPIIAFRKSLSSNLTQLGQQLVRAWEQCRLPYLVPVRPSGKTCISCATACQKQFGDQKAYCRQHPHPLCQSSAAMKYSECVLKCKAVQKKEQLKNRKR